ncbi:uncharacterized protein LOC134475450 [Cavia porcellus]|uniref:uncharacterized protein LOC134475450 n=1 Tax=Cavia porcellus TaxID=10141 RepID=UPI002FE0C112
MCVLSHQRPLCFLAAFPPPAIHANPFPTETGEVHPNSVGTYCCFKLSRHAPNPSSVSALMPHSSSTWDLALTPCPNPCTLRAVLAPHGNSALRWSGYLLHLWEQPQLHVVPQPHAGSQQVGSQLQAATQFRLPAPTPMCHVPAATACPPSPTLHVFLGQFQPLPVCYVPGLTPPSLCMHGPYAGRALPMLQTSPHPPSSSMTLAASAETNGSKSQQTTHSC